jgi:hypothetical protein
MFVLSALTKDTDFPPAFAASSEAEALVGGGRFIGGLGLVQVSECCLLPLSSKLKLPLCDDSFFNTQRVQLVNHYFPFDFYLT